MKFETNFSQLGSTHSFGPAGYEEAQRDPAWPAFVKEMENRAYGGEALEDAWLWFRAGYACSTQERSGDGATPLDEMLASLASKGAPVDMEVPIPQSLVDALSDREGDA